MPNPPFIWNWAEPAILNYISPQLVPVAPTPSVARKPTVIRATGPGTIAAGAMSVSVVNVGVAAGVFLGEPLNSGESVSFQPNEEDTLGPFSYDGTGTVLLITTLV